MRIQHNILAMNAYRNYNTNTSALAKNLEKLSSGYKINRAGDDAAGLAISEKMRAQITGLNAAQKNVKDGISLVKTAEGAMQEIQDMLNRMDYLATQSANGTYDDPVDRANLQKEVEALKTEINRIADSANFNGINLLDGSRASTSISAVGSLDTESMINGTAPTPAGKAQATVTVNSAKVNTTTAGIDATGTSEGVNPSAATASSITFTVADPTDAGNETLVGDATKGQFKIEANKSVSDIAAAAKDANGTLLKDLYDITVTKADGSKVEGWTDTTYKLQENDTITLTSKNLGKINTAEKTALTGLITNGGTPTIVDGEDEGAAGAAGPATYSFTLDLKQLEGGQKITLGANTLTIKNETDAASDNNLGIFGVNFNDDTAAKAFAEGTTTGLKEALTNTFSDYDVEVTYKNGGKADIKLTAKTGQNAAGNQGEVKVVTNSDKNPIDGAVTYKKYSAGAAAAAGSLAKVTYKSDALKSANLTAGTTINIGDMAIKVVADGTDTSKDKNAITESDAQNATKLAAFIEGHEDFHFGKVTYNATNGTMMFEAAESGEKLEELKAGTKITVETPDTTTAPTTITGDSGYGGLDITIGTTKLEDLKNKTVTVDGKAVKLGDVFNIKIGDKADGDVITAGDKITFEANQTGKLDDALMKAINYSTGASTEVRDGWDEGTDGSGNNTHYELSMNAKNMAGGQSFTFGNDSTKSFTFDLTYDNVETDNGTIVTPDKGTEVGNSTRTKINLSSSMSTQQIADKIKEVVGGKMTDFNVKVEVNGSNIKLSMDAKQATETTNLGGVRYSSANGAFTGAVYKAYNAFDGGTEGTYAQVSWKFDPSNLKSGDSLTIGGTTIKIGDKTATEKNLDGSYNVTLSEADAQDTEKLIKAFESAGYQSGQLKIAGGKLTITGTEAGQTADALSKDGGRVSLTSTRTLVSGGLTLQIGDTSDDFNQMTVAIGDMHTKGMGIDGVDISSQTGAKDAIQVIKNAINYVSSIRGDLGATQNRLEHTANNLSVMAENIQDAESTIRDTDIAEEMMAYTKNNILIQSAQAMLAQANAVPQGVLQLLG